MFAFFWNVNWEVLSSEKYRLYWKFCEKSFLLCWPWAFKGIAKTHTVRGLKWGWVGRRRLLHICHTATTPTPHPPPTMPSPPCEIFSFVQRNWKKCFPKTIFEILTSKIVRLNGSRFIGQATSKAGLSLSAASSKSKRGCYYQMISTIHMKDNHNQVLWI